MFSGFAVPRCRLRDAQAFVVADPQGELRVGKPLFGGLAVRRLPVVLRHALALGVQVPQGTLHTGKALVGGFAVP